MGCLKEYLLVFHHKSAYKFSNNTIGNINIYHRWPMMILIPKYYKEVMPSSWVEQHPALHKGLAGATIALFESLVTCPLERVKCQLMTQHESKSSIIYNL